jgi:hypothetical protein
MDMEALQGSNKRILFNLLPAHVATHFLDNQFRSNLVRRKRNTPCSLSLLGSKNVDFLGSLGSDDISAQKKTNDSPQRGFYVPRVSINCQACPKEVK